MEAARSSGPPRWPPWLAPVALIGGLVLAAVGSLIVDLPAVALGVKITTSHTPPGVTIANTFVQDLAFVGAAAFCAHLVTRTVSAWDLGLRRPAVGWRSAVGMVVLLIVAFLIASVIWSALVHPKKEKLLEQLGSGKSATLLLLSAALTCIVAPVCEEILFRGFIFTSLRNWRGTLFGSRVWHGSSTVPAALLTGLLFGGVHAGSAPALDLVPLAVLGFGLCLLYRRSDSLYPCFAAHSVNNSIAFASLESWSFGEGALLAAAALAAIAALMLALRHLGVIVARPTLVAPDA